MNDRLDEATTGGAGMGAHMQLGSAFMQRPASMIPYNQWAETDDDDLSAVSSGPAISAFQPFSVRDMLRLDDVAQAGEPVEEDGDEGVEESRDSYGRALSLGEKTKGVTEASASSLSEEKTRKQRSKENKARFAKMSPKEKAATKGNAPFHPDVKEDEVGAASLREGSQSWKKLWGKAKADLKKKGKGPASKSTLARMDVKQAKAGAEPNPFQGDPYEDPRYRAHQARRGVKTKGKGIRSDVEVGGEVMESGKWSASMAAHSKRVAANTSTMSDLGAVKKDFQRIVSQVADMLSSHQDRTTSSTSMDVAYRLALDILKRGAPKSAADIKKYVQEWLEMSECSSASVLREARPNPKTHPKMKGNINSPAFKAHVGDSDDSEKPYHKGKGIQKEAEGEKWIAGAIKRPGALKAKIEKRTKKGTIPAAELEKAAKKPGLTGQQARMAKTLRKLGKKK